MTCPPEIVPARAVEFGRHDQEAGCFKDVSDRNGKQGEKKRFFQPTIAELSWSMLCVRQQGWPGGAMRRTRVRGVPLVTLCTPPA